MAFVTKVWKDRLVEYAGRRKLTNVATGEELLVDVSRSEGTVNQAGDAFSATNMNNLEQRIKNEFDNLNDSLTNESAETFNFGILDGKRGFFTDSSRGADTFIPFKGEQVLTFTGYQYYSSPICMISAKNLSSLKVVQRRNEPLRGFYSNKFGNGSSVKFLDISVAGTYEIDLSNMPSDAVILSIYYSGNTAESRAIDFDAIVTYG